MITVLAEIIATEHRADLRRAADRSRRAAAAETPDTTRVELRHARHDDRDVVHRLAVLDEARSLEGPVLLAVVNGLAVAALSLEDGRVVADPFIATAEARSLLRLRAAQLAEGRGRRRLRRRRPRPRFA
jgi:azurin